MLLSAVLGLCIRSHRFGTTASLGDGYHRRRRVSLLGLMLSLLSQNILLFVFPCLSSQNNIFVDKLISTNHAAQATKTLLVTDMVVKVEDKVPEIVCEDPRPLLFHARDNALERVEDTPEVRLKGWRRIVQVRRGCDRSATFCLWSSCHGYHRRGAIDTHALLHQTQVVTVGRGVSIEDDAILNCSCFVPGPWIGSIRRPFLRGLRPMRTVMRACAVPPASLRIRSLPERLAGISVSFALVKRKCLVSPWSCLGYGVLLKIVHVSFFSVSGGHLYEGFSPAAQISSADVCSTAAALGCYGLGYRSYLNALLVYVSVEGVLTSLTALVVTGLPAVPSRHNRLNFARQFALTFQPSSLVVVELKKALLDDAPRSKMKEVRKRAEGEQPPLARHF